MADLPFATSARSTVGIEWELALVDADGLGLRPDAPTVLAQLKELTEGNAAGNIRPEFMKNSVEIVSPPSRNVNDAVTAISRSFHLLRNVGNGLGVELIGAGTHPFSDWRCQEITENLRYRLIADRFQAVARQAAIFGVHTHVGIDDRDKVLPIIRALLVYQPLLIALSASSPFWEGQDTGYASWRTILFDQLPVAGAPYQFETWDELSGYFSGLRVTNTIRSFSDVRWDIRPSLDFGTIEVRACDSISTIAELTAVCTLTHCLVEHFSQMIDDGEQLPTLKPWFVAENKWRAARYGLDARVIVDDSGGQLEVRDQLPQLLKQLRPAAVRLGSLEELESVLEIIEKGGSYERQRAFAEREINNGASNLESLRRVVAHLVAELKAG